MRQVVVPLQMSSMIYVIYEGWPCWLAPVLALKLPLVGAFFPSRFHNLFVAGGWESNVSWHDVEYFKRSAVLPQDCIVLASGSTDFLEIVHNKLFGHQGCLLFSVSLQFDSCSRRDLLRRYACWSLDHARLGLSSTVVTYADFEGVTLATHYICFCNISKKEVSFIPCTPRCLSHTPDFF